MESPLALHKNASKESLESQDSKHVLPLLRSNTVSHLESSNIKPNKYKYTCSVTEMYENTTGKHQYNSTTANYKLPDTSKYTEYKGRYQTEWNKSKSKRNTYVD